MYLTKIKTTIKQFLPAAALISALVFNPGGLIAQSIESLQEEINRINNEINQSEEHLDHIHDKKQTLQQKLAHIDSEVSKLQNEINLTNAKVSQTKLKLRATEEDLAYQKNIMHENAKTLYKIGDPTAVEILFSSNNFSEFINKQEYLERAKEAINEAAQKITALKEQLEKEEKELAQLSSQLNNQKGTLLGKRQEQQYLLDITRGEEQRYQALVGDLEARKVAAERKLMEEIRRRQQEAQRGNFVSQGRVNTGDVIGYVGSSGFSEGPHLHFTYIDSAGNFTDPLASRNPLKLKNNMSWPVPSSYAITQYFGCQSEIVYATPCGGGSWLHAGVDIAGNGDAVVAAKAGEIIFRGCDGAYGYKVEIYHDDGTITYYPHLRDGGQCGSWF